LPTQPAIKSDQEDEVEDGEVELAKSIFRLFKVENETQGCDVINMLELFSALIILADFSSQAEEITQRPPISQYITTANVEYECRIDDQSIELHAERMQAQNDQIEHKINLLITLFSFRDTPTLNISEIIIMCKTSLRSLHRVFPQVHIFRNQNIHEEIRTLLISMFQKRIEEQLRAEKLAIKQERQKTAKAVNIVHEGATWKKNNTMNEMNPKIGFSTTSGKSPMKKRASDNDLEHESIEEKKERLFKWNAFQTVKFTQEAIKETLIQNINVLRFLNLLESFDNTLLAWGSNHSL